MAVLAVPLVPLSGLLLPALSLPPYCLVPFGMPLSIAAWALAGRDLRMMGEGRMDPDGAGLTRAARGLAIIAIALGLGLPAVLALSYAAESLLTFP